MKFKKKKERNIGPVITLLILILVVVLTSFVFSIFEVQGQRTEINNGVLETSLITVNNALSIDGIKYIFSNAISNLQLFEPLVLLIISLIGYGIGEASGFFKAIFTPLKKIHPTFITFSILFIGIISSFFGEYSFVIILPIAALVYKYIGRRPMLGILTAFLGITIGYGTGLIPSIDDYILGSLSTEAAIVDVDKNYVYNAFSTIYLQLASTVILTIAGTYMIENILAPRVPKTKIEDDELIVSHKALRATRIISFLIIVGVAYTIIPGLPGSGMLLGTGNSYIERLFGYDSPFRSGLIIIILATNMLCGYAYGYLSRNIKNSTEYSVGMGANFEKLGYVFVLMFFAAQLIGLLEWTNIGNVLMVNIVDFMGTLEFSGMPLIIFMFIVMILIGIIMPSLSSKWILASPTLVPLLMRSNITPDFTQFIFRVADGISKSISPFFIYFIIMIAFLEKYNENDKYKVTILGTIKLILPVVGLFILLWLLIIVAWFMIGFPIGLGTYPTL